MHHSYNTLTYSIKPKEPTDKQKRAIVNEFLAFLKEIHKTIRAN